MMKKQMFQIAEIYVPTKRRASIDPAKVAALAESILEVGLESPILVRADTNRFVLVEGLQRLEAHKALGEETIAGYLVSARLH